MCSISTTDSGASNKVRPWRTILRKSCNCTVPESIPAGTIPRSYVPKKHGWPLRIVQAITKLAVAVLQYLRLDLAYMGQQRSRARARLHLIFLEAEIKRLKTLFATVTRSAGETSQRSKLWTFSRAGRRTPR
ncbi:hypothetical protein NEUTE1DRAFT_108261 [Neurospora tetrasperma FGSC 2508]|uniref:Uncharacterized protein n=1 Tax=Neurospora tetrasperma (strain FGSC 2508 / ATCC MYA-4615 / P0657) TaxID=510951 RepID=F8MGN6_NEUT8|nr:uncharacterized protein NEUTE1DRAFT_108261 [Neurospora tetrasperma FGSC 2508]EGO58658.1 hypothetical protein NEUTE1DRAFT_108261 [Neurospora tetrasperma FGSC 2508]EGZ72742.1 hypothetical protein NEUTE2DRAFT_127120 [Neurospora tetrasperma FGSC 2509]